MNPVLLKLPFTVLNYCLKFFYYSKLENFRKRFLRSTSALSGTITKTHENPSLRPVLRICAGYAQTTYIFNSKLCEAQEKLCRA